MTISHLLNKWVNSGERRRIITLLQCIDAGRLGPFPPHPLDASDSTRKVLKLIHNRGNIGES